MLVLRAVQLISSLDREDFILYKSHVIHDARAQNVFALDDKDVHDWSVIRSVKVRKKHWDTKLLSSNRLPACANDLRQYRTCLIKAQQWLRTFHYYHMTLWYDYGSTTQLTANCCQTYKSLWYLDFNQDTKTITFRAIEGTALTSKSQGFMFSSTKKSIPTISNVADAAATGNCAALNLIDWTPAANVRPAVIIWYLDNSTVHIILPYNAFLTSLDALASGNKLSTSGWSCHTSQKAWLLKWSNLVEFTYKKIKSCP